VDVLLALDDVDRRACLDGRDNLGQSVELRPALCVAGLLELLVRASVDEARRRAERICVAVPRSELRLVEQVRQREVERLHYVVRPTARVAVDEGLAFDLAQTE